VELRSIGIITFAVLAWSLVMVLAGQVAAIATLAPALGVTVQQIVRAARPRNNSASGHQIDAVPDREEDAAS
jgi:hypothetical protein